MRRSNSVDLPQPICPVNN
ncbi:hypothetical protein FD725_26415 [Nostoc sp. TCL26-01]|nr:hypothetical protein FD725_26415 [Nostoc sp. TCL26-01]